MALSFPAVTTNTIAIEQAGPNIIADPSFEAGPQADGFPVPSYNIGDRYSKSEQTPVEALSVSDHVAHSGRYSLKWDFSKAPSKGSVYEGRRYLIVNVQVPQNRATELRGKRVKVGYWLRLEGGGAVPGMTLREFGKDEFLGGISYSGGVDDPAVWNHFEVQGRLRDDFENLDIHISCPVPDDPEAARKAVFFIDDLTLQAIEEPPLSIFTSLDEYYIGEPIPWNVTATGAAAQVKVQLFGANQVVAGRTGRVNVESSPWRGAFETGTLKPGVYSLEASVDLPGQGSQTARQQIILSPDPFADN